MLVGREAERRRIERLVAGARVGQSGVLVITGEPGIGKTALLAHGAAVGTGMGALRAVGSTAEQEIPFSALHQLLRPALTRLDRIPAPQAQALAAALALGPGAAGDRFAIGAATLSLLCRFAEDRPVAILLDDVHLFDQPSVDALAFAARRLMADPIVLLATSRSAAPLGELPELTLTGVDLAAAAELLARHAPAPELLARLHQSTAGNPLALLELADVDDLAQTSPATPLPVSARLVTAFAAKARSLGEAARVALTVAAVAGSDLRVVAQACALLDVETAALAEPEAAGLVRLGQGQVEFTHPLVRAAVYSDTTPEHRRAVHRAIADALGPGEPDRRAWHLAEAVIGPADDVADLLRQAAGRASGRSAHHTAAAALGRAAALSSSAQRHAELCVAAAESAWLAGASTRATALLDEAGAQGVPAAGLPILRLRGAIAARTGSLVQAHDTLRSAVGAAVEPDTKVLLLADAISVCFYLGDAEAAIASAEQIEELLGQASSPWPRGLGQIAAGVARVLANRGGIDQVREAVDLLATAETEDQLRLPWLMIGPLFLRDTGSGERLRQRVGDARARAAVGTLPLLLFHVARDEATTNQWARAEATYDEAIALARETGQDTELAMCLAGLAWLLARLGREQECRALVAEALPLCRTRDIHVGRIWSLFALGELELGLGNATRALAHLDELQSVVDGLGLADPDLSPTPERTEALVRLGRRDDAQQAADRFASAAAAKGLPWSLARAARTAGTLGEDDDLDRHFLAALELHAQTPDVFETARTQLAYGVRLRRARRRADARPHLRAALACFEGLRAQRWADLAVNELQATGETTHRQASRGAQTLTPQELQVSLLLAEGRTTREVAAALFLSPKTVEYHLRKVYTKLGIRSRAELARELP